MAGHRWDGALAPLEFIRRSRASGTKSAQCFHAAPLRRRFASRWRKHLHHLAIVAAPHANRTLVLPAYHRSSVHFLARVVAKLCNAFPSRRLPLDRGFKTRYLSKWLMK